MLQTCVNPALSKMIMKQQQRVATRQRQVIQLLAILAFLHSQVTDSHSQSKPQKKARKPWVAPQVKILTQADLDRYTIFDVIMPLPGKDVDYPGGALGQKYKEYLLLDGLDPDNLERKQK
jgi:hypothetical protein